MWAIIRQLQINEITTGTPVKSCAQALKYSIWHSLPASASEAGQRAQHLLHMAAAIEAAVAEKTPAETGHVASQVSIILLPSGHLVGYTSKMDCLMADMETLFQVAWGRPCLSRQQGLSF